MILFSACLPALKHGRFFAILLMGFSRVMLAQSELTEPFDLNDHERLLIRLFDSDSISSSEEVLWTPLTFSDLLSSNVSSDGFVHTALDTIMYINANGVNMAVVLFETLPITYS